MTCTFLSTLELFTLTHEPHPSSLCDPAPSSCSYTGRERHSSSLHPTLLILTCITLSIVQAPFPLVLLGCHYPFSSRSIYLSSFELRSISPPLEPSWSFKLGSPSNSRGLEYHPSFVHCRTLKQHLSSHIHASILSPSSLHISSYQHPSSASLGTFLFRRLKRHLPILPHAYIRCCTLKVAHFPSPPLEPVMSNFILTISSPLKFFTPASILSISPRPSSSA